MKLKSFDIIKGLASALDETDLLESFGRTRLHHDEPKFWFYSASISDRLLFHDGSHFHSNASGVSFFSQEEAIVKVLVEAIERYSNFAFFKKDIDFTGSYSELRSKAIDPYKFVFFSDEQLSKEELKKYRINEKSIFTWTKVNSLESNKNYLVPCQAIYLSYELIKDEPLIYPSISTGVAAHFDLQTAILGGIYEIIERDSFMIYYLKKLKPLRYDLKSSKNKKIRRLIELADRYKMEIFSLDITTDLGIPAVTSIVVDRSGLSKAISVGLKSDFNVERAIIGSINEAFHTRSWIRESYIQNPTVVTEKDLVEDSSLKNRGLFWYSTKSISKLDFFLKNLKLKKVLPIKKDATVEDQILKLQKILKNKGYSVFYKIITPESLKHTKVQVVKVIIPGMQPVYLDENLPLKGGLRLQNVPSLIGYKKNVDINAYPHPFL